MKKRLILALFSLLCLGTLAGFAGWELLAQEGPSRLPVAESALGVLASTGNQPATRSFLDGVKGSSRGELGQARGSISMFIPDPVQLNQFGEKVGVVSFIQNLPRGGARIQILVRSMSDLDAVGDKEHVLSFLAAVGKQGGTVDLLLADLAGLARYGKNTSILAFVRALPAGSRVSIYTSPRAVAQFGADPEVLGFLEALPAPFEILLDSPYYDVLIKRWEAFSAAAGGR
ncbi:MAG: hypothetical protein ACYTFG_04530 [Planctomycetota bacterium]|jgi:hypothetical protein